MRLSSCTNMTFTPTYDDEKQAASRFFFFIFFFIGWHQLKQPHSEHLMARGSLQLTTSKSEGTHAHLSERGRSMHARRRQNSAPRLSLALSLSYKRACTREGRKGGWLTRGSRSSAAVQSTSSLTEDSHASPPWAANPASQGKVRYRSTTIRGANKSTLGQRWSGKKDQTNQTKLNFNLT